MELEEKDYLERFMVSVQYVGRMLKRKGRDHALPYELTKTQWFILRILSKKTCTIGELAEKLEVRSSSMSQMIDRLELSGLVKRQQDMLDGRSRVVVLSDKGKESLDAISHHELELLAVPFSRFSEEEQQVLVKLMETFKANLSESFEEGKNKS